MTEILAVAVTNSGNGSTSTLALVGGGIFCACVLVALFFKNRRK